LLEITESQNHRIVGVGRDLCGSSSPTLLLKQGHLQQAAQDKMIKGGLKNIMVSYWNCCQCLARWEIW